MEAGVAREKKFLLRPISAIALLEAALLAQTPQKTVIKRLLLHLSRRCGSYIPHSSNPLRALTTYVVPQPNLATRRELMRW